MELELVPSDDSTHLSTLETAFLSEHEIRDVQLSKHAAGKIMRNCGMYNVAGHVLDGSYEVMREGIVPWLRMDKPRNDDEKLNLAMLYGGAVRETGVRCCLLSEIVPLSECVRLVTIFQKQASPRGDPSTNPPLPGPHMCALILRARRPLYFGETSIDYPREMAGEQKEPWQKRVRKLEGKMVLKQQACPESTESKPADVYMDSLLSRTGRECTLLRICTHELSQLKTLFVESLFNADDTQLIIDSLQNYEEPAQPHCSNVRQFVRQLMENIVHERFAIVVVERASDDRVVSVNVFSARGEHRLDTDDALRFFLFPWSPVVVVGTDCIFKIRVAGVQQEQLALSDSGRQITRKCALRELALERKRRRNKNHTKRAKVGRDKYRVGDNGRVRDLDSESSS
jgi:hypothetical protein